MGRAARRRTARRRTTRRRTARRKARKVVRRRRKARKPKVKGSRIQVFRGSRQKTVGSLTKDDLVKNKRGKVVSKKAHARGKTLYKKNLAGWHKAFMQARENLNVTGFVACKKGTPLYE